MSRKMNRKQMSPVKIRTNSECRRNNLDADVQRIINHAAKLISTYNKNCLEQVMEGNLNNNEKIEQLLKQSTLSLPKIVCRKKSSKAKAVRKRKKALNNGHLSGDTKPGSCRDSGGGDESPRESSLSRELTLVRSDEGKCSMENPDHSLKSASRMSLTRCRRGSSASKSKSNLLFPERNEEADNSAEKEVQFLYELEIKTAESIDGESATNVMVQLSGESCGMPEPVPLNRLHRHWSDSRSLEPGSLACFTLSLREYLGTISNVKILFNAQSTDSSWYLDYICVKDLASYQLYFFSCRRWFGGKSQDKLSQITLGYTPPFKTEQHALLSSCSTENAPVKDAEVSEKSNRTIKSRESSMEIDGNRRDSTSSSSSFSESEIEMPARNEAPDVIPEQPGPSGSAIHAAIEANDLSRVKELCSLSEELKDAPDCSGCLPIHLAGRYYRNTDESREIIQYLISLGVDVNQKSPQGLVSLHYAILNNNYSAVQFLIEACRADPNIPSSDGDTGIDMANKYGFHQISRYLERVNKHLVSPRKDDVIGETQDKENVEYLFGKEARISHKVLNPEVTEEGPAHSGLVESEVQDASRDHRLSMHESEQDGSTEVSQDQNPIMVDNAYCDSEVKRTDEVILCKKDDLIGETHDMENVEYLFGEEASVSSVGTVGLGGPSDTPVSPDTRELPGDAKTSTIESQNDVSPDACQNHDLETKPEAADSIPTRSEKGEEVGPPNSTGGPPDPGPTETRPAEPDNPQCPVCVAEMMDPELQLLEEDQFDAEDRGIMFHKTLSLPLSRRASGEPALLLEKTLNAGGRQNYQPNHSRIDEESDTSPYVSKSKSTSLASNGDTMSTLTPRSHSEDTSSVSSIRDPLGRRDGPGGQAGPNPSGQPVAAERREKGSSPSELGTSAATVGPAGESRSPQALH